MSSEVDVLVKMADDLQKDLSKIQTKMSGLSRLTAVYESEIEKRDAYIRKLEDIIIQYRTNMRYW